MFFNIPPKDRKPVTQKQTPTTTPAQDLSSVEFGPVPEAWKPYTIDAPEQPQEPKKTKPLFETAQITAAKPEAFLGKKSYCEDIKIPTNIPMLSQMWYSVPKIPYMNEKQSWVDDLLKKSAAMGITGGYYTETPIGSKKPREYLYFSTNFKLAKDLAKNGFKDFPEWLEWQKHQDTGIVLLDRVVIDITDIDEHNYCAKNSYIIRYVQNMAVVKTAFENEGYPLPDHVSPYVVSSI